ncbi:MAG: 1-acyl-sn-glycerol-3-phosphate acyltransferase [Bacteroidota bacterium]
MFVLYQFFRIFAFVGLRVFYRRRMVLGRENLHFSGPAIIVINHPSTIMDVFNVCVEVRQSCYFLANYSLFKHPVSNWILRRMYCIPVKRKEDLPEGADRNNSEALDQSVRHIQNGGVLFIAAEGVSWMDRVVRPFKTGVARIALGAESSADWQLDVKLIPVGLSYSAPDQFRSDVIIHFGQPVHAAEWRDAWLPEPDKAVSELTSHLQKTVSDLTLTVHDLELQPVADKLEIVAENLYPREKKAYFNFRKSLIERNIRQPGLTGLINTYFKKLEESGVSDAGINPSKNSFLQYLTVLAGAIPALAGRICWFVPFFVPKFVSQKLNLYPGYNGALKMFLGFFTVPVWLRGIFRAVFVFTGSNMLAWTALAASIALGYYSAYHERLVRALRARRQAEQLPPTQLEHLRQQRESVLATAGLSVRTADALP